MQVKHIPLKQLQAIKANGYVGEHDRKGKQTDYADYISEIDARIAELTLSKITQGQIDRFNHEPPIDMSFLDSDRLIDDLLFKKTFNHWAYLAQKLQWGL